MKQISAIILLLFPFFSNAIILFENSFGNSSSYNEGLAVVVLDSSNYFVSGTYLNVNSNNWHSNMYFLNNELDSISTNIQDELNGYCRKSADDNIFFFGGNKASFNYDSIRISKADFSGNLIWKTEIRLGCRNTVTDLREAADGNIYISGFYSKAGCSLPVYNAFIAKLSASGQLIWLEKIDGGKNDQLHQIAIDGKGDIVAGGWSNSFNTRGDSDYYITKYDSTGTMLFQNNLSFETQDYAYGIATDSENNIYLSGYSKQVQLIKFSPKGDKLLAKDLFSVCGGNNFRIRYTENNSLLMLGSEEIDNNCTSYFMEVDMLGNILWKKNWFAQLRAFESIKPGSYILTGYKDYLPEMYVVKFDTGSISPSLADTIARDTIQFETNSDTAEEIETSIENNENISIELNFYPNPFVNNVNVKWNTTVKVNRITVYSMKGQVIAQYTVNAYQNLLNIDAVNWASGNYLISTELENGKVLINKLNKF